MQLKFWLIVVDRRAVLRPLSITDLALLALLGSPSSSPDRQARRHPLSSKPTSDGSLNARLSENEPRLTLHALL